MMVKDVQEEQVKDLCLVVRIIKDIHYTSGSSSKVFLESGLGEVFKRAVSEEGGLGTDNG